MAEHTPEHFADWNDQMIQRYDPELINEHPRGVVRWVENRRASAVIHLLNARAEHRILDVGCGGGSILARLPGNRREGIDLSPTMVQRAQKKLGAAASIAQGDAETLPFDDGLFDRVVASSLLSHVRNPDKVIAELARVTKPGGRIVISVCHEEQIEKYLRWAHAVPGAESLFGLNAQSTEQRVYHTDYHLHRFSAKRLRDAVGKTLQERDCRCVPALFPVHFVAAYER
jgi:ubiquinone/menaquinone biosynthesis C-methylase UbiE